MLESTVQTFIDERMLHIEQMFENKINSFIEKQQQIPRDIMAKKQCKNAIKSRHRGKKQCIDSHTKHKESNERNSTTAGTRKGGQ